MSKPFGIKDKIGYLMGDIGNDFTFVLSSTFLLKFYTDVMGVPAAIVGAIIMIARFVDAFTDVTMGRICDKSPIGKDGKFKPWIRRMCVPVAITSFALYQNSLADESLTFKVIYLFVVYILWGSFLYTSINIPYGSMASAISPEPGDRQSLSTYRSIGATFASVLVGAIIPLIAYKEVNGVMLLDGAIFTKIAGVFSICAIISYMICYGLVTERVKIPSSRETKKDNNVLAMLKNAVTNKALISIIVASILMLLAQMTLQSMANYVFPIYYGNTTAQSVSMVVMLIGSLAIAAVAKPISTRFGKAEVGMVSSLIASGVCILLFIIRPQNVWVYVALQGLCWMALGVFSMISWALVTDVIDYSEIKNGIREDGSVYALYSFARKLGQAGAAGVVGSMLTAIGYTEGAVSNAGVREGIFNISTLIPAVGFALLGIVLWFWYPLHKKQVEENVKVLRKKR
ncbi:MAG: MFS transporter [Agathobacter sp.]|nr:MFS transporter [Agathobacter sp.]